ncbi:MAG: sigma 54-interacting transcriptional regulator [Deltaproteobacteria bacterium]|nr:sigma 54-interacting transcriptional regulator [Deltaproteobacteria bacterium]
METETDVGGRLTATALSAPAVRLVESATVPGQALVDMRIPIAAATTIGRGPAGVGLAIVDPRMSGRHVTLIPEADGGLYFVDHESKNGTFVNGRRVTSGRLWVGDVLRCGTTIFVVVEGGAVDEVDEDPKADRIGLGAAIQAAWTRARAAAGHDVAVLVLGPTGSGKEGVARLVHEASGRRGPWLAVNCATLGGETATAALFGHERGAFTGAAAARRGCFREAERGTLFLDEIGDLPLDVQPRLLRALEQKEVVPLGASRPVQVDVRLVAATNADLSAKILDHRFRADLYARLASWIIEVPSLASRREDVLRLARHFAGRSPGRAGALTDVPLFGVELAERLLLHAWPYNVRELRQLVLALRVAGEPPWDEADLPAGFGAATVATSGPAPNDPALEDTAPGGAAARRRPRMRARPERDELVRALERHGYNVSAVARELGRDRKQIYRWAELYAIALHEDD